MGQEILVRAAERDKLQALSAYNEARGVTDQAASAANYLTPLTELAEKGQDALHDLNRQARTAVADALTSAGLPSVLVGAVTLPSHVFDSVVDFDAGFVWRPRPVTGPSWGRTQTRLQHPRL